MKPVLLFVFFIFFISCSSGANEENLDVYREKALRHLVKERIQKEIQSIEFENKVFFKGFWFAIFQTDNVDRSQAVFQISGGNNKTHCGLYIRETTETELAINLIECNGPYAKKLSDNMGLSTVSKEQLQEL